MKIHKIKIIVISSIMAIFVIYNIFWFCVVHLNYNSFIEGMNEFRPNVSYVLEGNDGYLYNVKNPDYLSYTGNACVSTKDGKVALLIWPGLFRETKYGVQITTNDNIVYSIIIDKNAEAIDSQYKDMIIENSTIIQVLFQKAEKQWNIK